jgi:hypothetical protein
MSDKRDFRDRERSELGNALIETASHHLEGDDFNLELAICELAGLFLNLDRRRRLIAGLAVHPERFEVMEAALSGAEETLVAFRIRRGTRVGRGRPDDLVVSIPPLDGHSGSPEEGPDIWGGGTIRAALLLGLAQLEGANRNLGDAVVGISAGENERTYAEIAWTADDVRTLRPASMTDEQIEDFLAGNAKYIRDELVPLGWGIIETLLCADGHPRTEADENAEDGEETD